MTRTGIIYGVNGPIVHVKGDVGFEMHEMVMALSSFFCQME